MTKKELKNMQNQNTGRLLGAFIWTCIFLFSVYKWILAGSFNELDIKYKIFIICVPILVFGLVRMYLKGEEKLKEERKLSE